MDWPQYVREGGKSRVAPWFLAEKSSDGEARVRSRLS